MGLKRDVENMSSTQILSLIRSYLTTCLIGRASNTTQFGVNSATQEQSEKADYPLTYHSKDPPYLYVELEHLSNRPQGRY